MIVLIRNYVSVAINIKIDSFLEKYPEKSEHREDMYQFLLNAYHEYGVVADLVNSKEGQAS